MFPLYDEAHNSRRFPLVTILLIVANVYIFFSTATQLGYEEIILRYGAIPFFILRGENLPTLISSLFLHADLIHLLGNMWFLWIFGDNIESSLGKIKFLFLYFLAGIVATIAHALTTEDILIPVIGASGAISGVLGAYLVLYPTNHVRTLFYLFRINVPAFIYLFIWFALQFLYLGQASNVAHVAHIAGFIVGVVIGFFQRIR